MISTSVVFLTIIRPSIYLDLLLFLVSGKIFAPLLFLVSGQIVAPLLFLVSGQIVAPIMLLHYIAIVVLAT